MELKHLIAELSRPGAYPFAVKDVEVRQTHISVVFLAGPWAYKIKSPSLSVSWTSARWKKGGTIASGSYC
jgi:hypothetical protein